MDESISRYEWALKTFLITMTNKKPIYVVIDGDKVMHKAIKKVLLDACHRICAWHLQRNTFTNVHIKDFTSAFVRYMFMRGNPEEFEHAWHEMFEKCVNGNRWKDEKHTKV